jgi:ribose transport system ATP-binding protein
MKILAGLEAADEGLVEVAGQKCSSKTAADAAEVGIAIVFHELSLYPVVDIVTNLFANCVRQRKGMVRRGEMRRLAEPVLERIGLRVELDARLETLPLDEQQLVEIAKALLFEPQILILDEPTSVLTTRETARLFETVRRLRDRGVAILFVSHRLEEVFAIADVISVMRDGNHTLTATPMETTMDQVVTEMIGQSRRSGRTTHVAPATTRKSSSSKGSALVARSPTCLSTSGAARSSAWLGSRTPACAR